MKSLKKSNTKSMNTTTKEESLQEKLPISSERNLHSSELGGDSISERQPKEIGGIEVPNGEPLYRQAIDGTPFYITGVPGRYFITMGIYKLSPELETTEKVLEYLEYHHWNIISRMISSYHEAIVTQLMKEMEVVEKPKRKVASKKKSN